MAFSYKDMTSSAAAKLFSGFQDQRTLGQGVINYIDKQIENISDVLNDVALLMVDDITLDDLSPKYLNKTIYVPDPSNPSQGIQVSVMEWFDALVKSDEDEVIILSNGLDPTYITDSISNSVDALNSWSTACRVNLDAAGKSISDQISLFAQYLTATRGSVSEVAASVGTALLNSANGVDTSSLSFISTALHHLGLYPDEEGSSGIFNDKEIQAVSGVTAWVALGGAAESGWDRFINISRKIGDKLREWITGGWNKLKGTVRKAVGPALSKANDAATIYEDDGVSFLGCSECYGAYRIDADLIPELQTWLNQHLPDDKRALVFRLPGSFICIIKQTDQTFIMLRMPVLVPYERYSFFDSSVPSSQPKMGTLVGKFLGKQAVSTDGNITYITVPDDGSVTASDVYASLSDIYDMQSRGRTWDGMDDTAIGSAISRANMVDAAFMALLEYMVSPSVDVDWLSDNPIFDLTQLYTVENQPGVNRLYTDRVLLYTTVLSNSKQISVNTDPSSIVAKDIFDCFATSKIENSQFEEWLYALIKIWDSSQAFYPYYLASNLPTGLVHLYNTSELAQAALTLGAAIGSAVVVSALALSTVLLTRSVTRATISANALERSLTNQLALVGTVTKEQKAAYRLAFKQTKRARFRISILNALRTATTTALAGMTRAAVKGIKSIVNTATKAIKTSVGLGVDPTGEAKDENITIERIVSLIAGSL